MNTEEQQLMTVSSEWAEAMLANDATRIGSFMSEEWVIVSERGIQSKEYLLSFIESGALTHSTFDMVGEPRIKIYGDTAVVTCRVVNTAHFGGQQIDQDEFSTDVFVRRDGKWVCVLSHLTSANKEFLKEQESR